MSDPFPTTDPLISVADAGGRVVWRGRRTFTRGDKAICDYWAVPFDVPDGLGRLTVRYAFSGEVDASVTDGSGNVVDIGIWDPRGHGFGAPGFRGWSGSFRRSFTLGRREETTPGYVTGPIYPGRWHLILGLYQIRPDGCTVELEIVGEPGSASADAAVSPGAGIGSAPAVTLGGPLWCRGDLHAHTHHSDAPGSVRDLIAAAQARGLDFIAVTDHNTVSAWAEFDTAAAGDLLLIPGEEITTYRGHANVWAGGRWYDFRAQTAEELAQILAAARAAGALVSINHPRLGGPAWEWGTDLPFDGVEVWNGWWPWRNAQALAFWEDLLRQGRRVIAVGGSDRHQGSVSGVQSLLSVGQPTTWVFAPERSLAGVLAGLRSGRVCISAEPEGPHVDLSVAAADGRVARMGEALEVCPGEPLRFCAKIRGGAGYRLRWVVGGETAGWEIVDGDDAELAFASAASARYVRVQLEDPVTDPADAADPLVRIVALSNPVWIDLTA